MHALSFLIINSVITNSKYSKHVLRLEVAVLILHNSVSSIVILGVTTSFVSREFRNSTPH